MNYAGFFMQISENEGYSMNNLQNARRTIEKIDAEMAELFEKRMKAAETVAEFKKENALPIEDKKREAELTAKNCEFVSFECRPYYESFIENVMEVSKKYQKRLLEGMRIAYSGVEGAFAHIAAMRIFKCGETVSCPDFDSAYKAVEDGECDCAVLPIENSYAGDVDRVLDLAFHGKLSVSGIYDMPLGQSLLAKPGTNMEDITEVRSHPQALSQCMPYLKEHGWKLTQAVNTAVAAKSVAEGDRSDIAVVASKDAAELYGLKILQEDINENKKNTTRFAVFTRSELKVTPKDEHFLIMFTTKNEPGSLGGAIAVIGEYRFNLRSLKSRPTGNANWEYYFYAEGEGNIDSLDGRKMIHDLKKLCENVKILGSFSDEKILDERGAE